MKTKPLAQRPGLLVLELGAKNAARPARNGEAAVHTGGNISDEMPWKKYAGMDDTEIKALYACLQATEALPTNK